MKKVLSTSVGQKYQSQIRLLKSISTSPPISRADLARMTGFTKTTISKLALDLIAAGYIEELDTPASDSPPSLGRKPVLLDIAADSPVICGMLIKRGLCSVILSDLKGRIIAQSSRDFESITKDALEALVMELYYETTYHSSRKIIAIGISSIGPVDTITGQILNPPFFYGISNLALPKHISQITDLPVYIINDANAGALAENLYGNDRECNNFIYLHIMNGIGAGYVLDGHIYNGYSGQSGEIGHTTINFSGPLCDCGNCGCLDLYANIDNMNKKILQLKQVYKGQTLLPILKKSKKYSFEQIVTSANKSDPLAFSALDDFCEYISHALTNTINILALNHIIVGYDSSAEVDVVEKLLAEKLNTKCLARKYQNIDVEKSSFCGDAPLVGSIALIADKIFNCEIVLPFFQ